MSRNYELTPEMRRKLERKKRARKRQVDKDEDDIIGHFRIN